MPHALPDCQRSYFQEGWYLDITTFYGGFYVVLHQFLPIGNGCINLSSRVNLKVDFHCLEMLYICVFLQIFVFNLNENLITSSILDNIFY